MSKVVVCKRKLKTRTITEKYKILKEVEKRRIICIYIKEAWRSKANMVWIVNRKKKNLSMFTQSGEIGTLALKTAKLFEKELCESMKQTFISLFREKITF